MKSRATLQQISENRKHYYKDNGVGQGGMKFLLLVVPATCFRPFRNGCHLCVSFLLRKIANYYTISTSSGPLGYSASRLLTLRLR